MPKAYPVYDLNYSKNVDNISNWITKDHPNIHPIGRNGMHRYNNQDHSMMTAIKSVRNILKKKITIFGQLTSKKIITKNLAQKRLFKKLN